jgi:hypothetical protein
MGDAQISVENEEYLSKAVDFRELSVGVSTALTNLRHQEDEGRPWPAAGVRAWSA